MAKNKNRKQPRQPELPHRLEGTGGTPPGGGPARSGAQHAKSAVTKAGTDLAAGTPGGPGHGARTKQRRFGHN